MNDIICRGDVHGDAISAFSYKKHPYLRNCFNDVFVICGDFGIPFGVEAPYYLHNGYKSDLYQLQWLENKLLENNNVLYVLLGNHDDRIAASQMPLDEDKTAGIAVRQMALHGRVFENIYVVTHPIYVKIYNQYCLFIPGGTSHDADVILDPKSRFFKKDLAYERKAKKSLWRIKDWEWWPDEVVDTSAAIGLARDIHNGNFPKPDYVFSHEAPAAINKWYKRPGFPGRLLPTEGEKALQEVYNLLPPFSAWWHGHYHFTDAYSPNLIGDYYKSNKPIGCIYKDFYNCTQNDYCDMLEG